MKARERERGKGACVGDKKGCGNDSVATGRSAGAGKGTCVGNKKERKAQAPEQRDEWRRGKGSVKGERARVLGTRKGAVATGRRAGAGKGACVGNKKECGDGYVATGESAHESTGMSEGAGKGKGV